MKVELHNITPEADIDVVRIARVSSSRKDTDEEPEQLINYLIRNNHWSPFEHGMMSIKIETSIPIAVQFLRHVSFRFQQFSQRYAVVTQLEPIEFRKQAVKNRQSSEEVMGSIFQDEDGNLQIHIPDINKTTMDFALWIQRVSDNLVQALELYDEGIKMGVAKETARFILPQAVQTTMYMSGTIRSWIHMLDIRDEKHAQKEIQVIAKKMKNIFIENLPMISKAREYETSTI